MTLLIAGTDTEVGKTVLTTALVAYWHKYYVPKTLGLMKLVQAGKGDRELYEQLFTLQQPPHTLAPLYFKTPVAPPIAARQEGQPLDLGKVWQASIALQQGREFVLVEALGGLGSPVTEELTVADVARDWRWEVVLVVPVKLGAIAQTVANVALARHYNVQLKGIVLNCLEPTTSDRLADWTPIDLIQSLTGTPVLGVVPHLSDPTDINALAQVASQLALEQILPRQLPMGV